MPYQEFNLRFDLAANPSYLNPVGAVSFWRHSERSRRTAKRFSEKREYPIRRTTTAPLQTKNKIIKTLTISILKLFFNF